MRKLMILAAMLALMLALAVPASALVPGVDERFHPAKYTCYDPQFIESYNVSTGQAMLGIADGTYVRCTENTGIRPAPNN
jgi:hypothetical protein